MRYLERVRQQIYGEQGAEIVEWVLWVGGIAILAGAMYTVVSGAVTNLVTSIMGSMGVTGS